MVVGGGEIWDIEIARKLEAQGVNVTFFTGKPLFRPPQFRYDEEPFSTEFVSTPHLQEHALSAPIGIGGLLSDIDNKLFKNRVERRLHDGFDVIHINSRPQFLRMTESFSPPMTITMHGLPHSLIYDYLLPGASSYDFFDLADAVIGTGETAELISERTGIGTHTINPGVNTSVFTPGGPAVDLGDGPALLWVGRFVPVKDLPLFIEAFAELHDAVPNATAYLIGDGPKQKKIRVLADDYDINDSVRFLGQINHNELPKYYRSSDLFTLSSKHESFGIVLLEAMACGLPVVAPDIGYIPQIIDDGQDGRIVESRTPSAFATAWENLLTDPEKTKRLGKQARDTARANFEWENKAEELLEIFQAVSARRQ
jgi:glycosyltransferase involved in cell wall biosynthesis